MSRPGLVHTHHRAFARVEAVALAVVVFMLIAILLAIAPYERRTAMLNRDLANLRQMGAWTANYANDFEDLHPSFTEAVNSIYPDIRALSGGAPLRLASGHAIDIIRRRTGRNSFPLSSNWFPHVMFTHLVLADYTEMLLPDTRFVAAGDKHRLKWLDDPINKHDQGFWQPYQQPQGGIGGPIPSSTKRWAYSSSYRTPSGFWDQTPNPGAVSQISHYSYSIRSGLFGPVPLSDVAFPAQKVLLHAVGSWYTSRTTHYFAHDIASATVLMSDGAAALRRTADANAGWNPNSPTSPDPTLFGYYPRSWEPPAIDPSGRDILKGYYYWTRGRLDGRDFDGPEIDTGQK